MVAHIRIGGDVEKLRELGGLLKEAGDKDLKREFYKSVQRATRPVKEEIKQSARDTLPHGGGLNEWVAGLTIRTKQSYNGRMPGVTIQGAMNNKKLTTTYSGGKRKRTRRKGTFGAQADLRAINRGRVMHPVFGHGPLVGPQMVTAGFWDKPLTGVTTQRAKREVREAMQRVTELVAARMRSAA
jgi:hypothetical protein